MNLEDTFNTIDFNDIFSNLNETIDVLCESSKRKIVKRKFRLNNKQIKYRYLMSYNPVAEYMLDNYSFGIRMINRLLKRTSE